MITSQVPTIFISPYLITTATNASVDSQWHDKDDLYTPVTTPSSNPSNLVREYVE